MNRMFRTKCTWYVNADGAERVLRVVVAPLRRQAKWGGTRPRAVPAARHGANFATPALWHLSVAVALAWVAVLTIRFV